MTSRSSNRITAGCLHAASSNAASSSDWMVSTRFPARQRRLFTMEPLCQFKARSLLGEPFGRRTYFGQFDELCFVLNWLAWTCSRSTADSMTPKCRLKSVKWIYFNHPSQGKSTDYCIILGPRDKAAPPTSQQISQFPPKRVKYRHCHHLYFYLFLIHRRTLCSQPIRGNVPRTCWAKLFGPQI